MNEEKAIEIIGKENIRDDNGFSYIGSEWADYDPLDEKSAILDGTFNLEQLEALIWWMKNK